MFEGKHLHFSPADNKPLCSYSSKLCRQRRLNGYAFCIRHILEDKSAPFKRCTYVTRNNNQICQNAIPTSQERGYCHSHMQVAGIIPKTERKIKNPPPTKPVESNGTLKLDSNSNSSNSNSNSNLFNGVKKDPNAVFKFEEEPTEIQWIPKGGRINGIVNGGKVAPTKGKDGHILLKKQSNRAGGDNGLIHNEHGKRGTAPIKKSKVKNGKLHQTVSNGVTAKDVPTKTRQTYGGKKSTASGKQKVIVELTNIDALDNFKQTFATSVRTNENSLEPINGQVEQAVTLSCTPEYDKYFDQLRTLQSVEKSVSNSKFSGVTASTTNKQRNASSCSKPTNSRTILSIPTHPKSTQLQPKANRNCNSKNSVKICSPSSSTSVDLFNSVCAQKVKNSLLPFSEITKSKNCLESRQEFLARVRHAFKSQYMTVKNSANDSDKNEKIWKRALRNSLLTCVVKDSSYCAHVIVQNDPKKYSDLNANELFTSNGKNSPKSIVSKTVAVSSAKNGKGKQGKKNMLGPTSVSGSREIKSVEIRMNLNKDNSITDSAMVGSFSDPIEGKLKQKASKRTPTDSDGKLSSHKKKARKTAHLTVNSCLVSNGIDESGSESSSQSQSPSAHIPSTRSISSKTSAFDSLSIALNSKKRKFDALNCSDPHLNSSFRTPKLEDSSHLSDIDIKMENGQIVYNNFNGHISNHHHQLLHPHSGSATTAKASNLSNAQVQLQHLLSQPDLRTLGTTINAKNQRNQGINTVLNSVGSSDMGTSDGVITDASFDSTFDHSVSSQQDCEFSDDDLEKSLEFQIDPETEHQASRLLEDNELTEDDLNELFPETNKLVRSDLSDLGVDFSSAFDANDIDYSLFANIFPFSRSSQSESISISNQY